MKAWLARPGGKTEMIAIGALALVLGFFSPRFDNMATAIAVAAVCGLILGGILRVLRRRRERHGAYDETSR